MLANSLLPTTFWVEADNTACYVQNRVLGTKPHNKTPYELLRGRPSSISFMRPFECPVTILNTLDPLGKFDGKADEGFLVRYSINSKAFRVFNTRIRKLKENLHITFLENKPNVAGSGTDWLFDIDLLTNSMNYEPVTIGNQTNRNAGIKDIVDAGERNGQEKEGGASNKEGDQNVQDFRVELDNLLVQQKEGYATSTNRVSTVSPSVSAAGQSFDNADDLPTDPLMPDLEDTADLLNTGIFSGDLNNLEKTMNVSPIPTTIIHKDHPKDQIIGDINSATQTRRMTKISEAHALIEAMQDELLQFRLQKVWRLVDLPKGKHAIGTKWVYRNKKDERGIVVRNKARLVTQVSTPIKTNKVLLKDKEAEDVDVYLYRSMIRSLMYLTASRPDIMFAVCACARFQVTPKVSHLNDVKRIFSNYAGASLDRKSTTGAEYVAAANCYGQVYDPKKSKLLIMGLTSKPKIHIDNESTICIVKNPVFHSKTKHIEIRHHLIRDSYEKKLIQVIKIHTNHNVVDLLTKAFDVSRMRLSIRSGRPEWEWATTTASRSRGGQWLKLMLPVQVNAVEALVYKKKVIISETSIRSDLKLDDAEGTNCLPTATIFAELERICAKTTSWNEFSSTMASVIICLAINQKFNIFDNMVKNLDGGVKILMYPRFVEVFLDKQVEGMSKHKGVCVTPSHTKKKKSRRKQRKDNDPIEPTAEETTLEEYVSTPSYDPPPSGKDRMQLAELMSLCTNLQEKVLDLEKAKTTQAKEITSLKKRVKQLEKRRKSRTLGLRRLRKVGSSSRVESSNNSSLGAQEDASKQGRKIKDLDANAEVTSVVEEPEVSVATTTKSIPVSAAEVVTTASASVVIPDELTILSVKKGSTAGVYSVPMQGAYNPPEYAQP
ncbi:putative ribonuclease H-like domain-containing protein [Tanacetum coccineum]